MADDAGIVSIRSIVANYDYLSNWITAIAVSCVFAALASLYDKVTGVAILLAVGTSTALAATFWPVLLDRGYGGLSWTLLFGVICGLAGATILHTLIYIVRRRVSARLGRLADGYFGPEEKS